MLSPTASVYARQKRVMFQNPGPPVPDGRGGYTQTWTDVPPSADVAIMQATVNALERIAAGTVLSTATHIVTAPYRAGISTKTRILVDGRVLNVTSVQDVEERHVTLVLVCAEVVQ